MSYTPLLLDIPLENIKNSLLLSPLQQPFLFFFIYFFFSNHHASLPVLPQNKIRAKSFSPSPTPAESHQGWVFRLHLKTVPPQIHCSIIAVMTLGLQHLNRALLYQWTLSIHSREYMLVIGNCFLLADTFWTNPQKKGYRHFLQTTETGCIK